MFTTTKEELTMYYETERLSLKTIEISDLSMLKDYLLRNKNFLSPWEPQRKDSYYEDNNLVEMIEQEIANNSKQSQLSLYISLKDEARIIGNVTLSNIIRGVFQSCYIGYKLDQDEVNKGLMTEAVAKMIDITFNELKLHRIEANIMPRNKPSKKVVQKMGFEYEGLSKEYLKINSIWEDHEHYAILNRDMK